MSSSRLAGHNGRPPVAAAAVAAAVEVAAFAVAVEVAAFAVAAASTTRPFEGDLWILS